MAMDARKQRILEAIVALYANDGEPVGSGLLANYFDMALSSATLRNEMAALTKLGLLEQPHTSAGRVPSAQGYRYYLDHLIDAPKSGTLPEKDRRRIDDLFAAMDAEPEKLVPAATRCLADMTGCAAAATTPQAPDLCIAHFEVVQVGRYSAAVLAVTSAGGVRTRVARVDTGLTRDDAANLAQLLNRGLTFVAPQDLSPMLMASMVLAAGQRLAPVIMAAQALVTTGPQACLRARSIWRRWRTSARTSARCWRSSPTMRPRRSSSAPKATRSPQRWAATLTLRCRVPASSASGT